MKLLLTSLMLLCVFVSFGQDNLDEYKGVFKMKEGSPTATVEISVQNGSLYANSAIGSAGLAKVSKDTFSIPDYSGVIYFYRNDKGVITSIKVEVNNLIMEGDKEQKSVAYLRRRMLIVGK